jgi:hypothetical protein
MKPAPRRPRDKDGNPLEKVAVTDAGVILLVVSLSVLTVALLAWWRA